MMLKFFILVLIFFSSTTIHAQQFEWASSGGNLNAGFKASVMDAKGNIIVAGTAEIPYNFYSGPSFLYSSTGDSIEIIARQTPMIIVSFDPYGNINWKREVQYGGEPVGIVINSKNQISVLSEVNVSGRVYFQELNRSIQGGRQYYIYTMDAEGKPLHIIEDTEDKVRNANSFFITNDDRYLIAGQKYIEKKNAAGYKDRTWHNYIMKVDSAMGIVWESRMEYHNNGSSMTPECRIDQAANGDIYIVTSVLNGVTFGDNSFKAPLLKKDEKQNDAYEAYLACYNKSGTLKWVKRSGGKSIFSAIKVTGSNVLLGGTVINNKKLFGRTIDTTGKKNMILVSFDKSGQVLWAQTSRADKVTAITIDQDNNVYTVVNCRNTYPYLVYETDTLRNAFESLVIASYKSNGDFRWVKHCKIPMNTNELPQLLTDKCGNIYVSGEMWSVLRAQLKWFDGAFVKGDSYGPAPFVAKLKNTLPEKMFENLVRKCVISPAPWTIYNYPNPFNIQTTIQYKTSYDDDKVSLSVYDMTGKLVSIIFQGKTVKAGTYTVPFIAGSLSRGGYVLVLKGTEAVATERILIL